MSILVLLAACEAPPPPSDGGGADASRQDAGAEPECRSDAECDDDLFCNGISHCAPADPAADARGCLPIEQACAPGQECDETARVCAIVDCSVDADGDGHLPVECGGDDCDEGDANRFAGNLEVCDAAGHDEDCDPSTLGPDRDGDGFVSNECCRRTEAGTLECGTDCADASADVSPTAPEVCDSIDDDCDGRIDEDVLTTFYRDVDGDGYGDSTMTVSRCGAPPSYVLVGGDCDDTRVGIHPGASETCNEVDDDCDGVIDPSCPCAPVGSTTTCGPSDGAGGFLMVGACRAGIQTCTAAGSGPCEGAVFPAAESCNGVDDDCDGTTDEGVTTTFYRDTDGDGYGDPSMTRASCGAPAGYAPVPGDCDDSRAATFPGAPESCNLMDDNCNGTVDESVRTTFYRDADGDGFGGASMLSACSAPSGYGTTTGDCDDMDPLVRPGVPDPCDMVDNNCDGTADLGCTCTNGATQMCGTPDPMGGFLMRGICMPGEQTCVSGMWGSCVGNVDPVPESCNMLDDDCDGAVDDGVRTNYYRDCDGDGYGATGSVPMAGCTAPATPPSCGTGTGVWVANSGDCNDGSAAIHPMITDVCDNVDNDCDGLVDGPAAAMASCSALPPHTSSSSCPAGTCLYTCTSPYLDCSTSAGCETNAATSTSHCGECGHACRVSPRSCVVGLCEHDYAEVSRDNVSSCGRRNDGTVWCWGGNAEGQLGDGTTTARSTPVQVSGVTNATQISVGYQHACALLSTGSVMCWGDNRYGQIGDGTTTDRRTARAVSGLSDGVFVYAGLNATCAIRTSGQLLCWGNNDSGQVGDGTMGTDRLTPVVVPGITDALKVAGGGMITPGAQSFTCVLRATGAVWCWGWNSSGELGRGSTTSSPQLTPAAVSGVSDAVGLACDAARTCVLRAGGGVSCWGGNHEGQLGDGTTTNRSSPVAVTGLSDATSIAVRDYVSCALRASGAVVCWGGNTSGNVGDGTTVTPRLTPTPVVNLPGGAAQIAAGCAVLRSDEVRCWGRGVEGQLGDGASADSPTPVSVSGS